MFFKQLGYLTFLLILFGCGGGGDTTQSPNQTDFNSPLLPQSINNKQLKLTIDNGSLSSAIDLPAITQSLSHYFGNGDIVYLQSENDKTWQYRGVSSFIKGNNNTATINISLNQSDRNYAIECTFTETNSGTWQAQIEQGISLSGSFTLSNNNSPEEYAFKGTIEDEATISSSITGITYPYRVYLPVGYHTEKKSYPEIYATDGQWEFWRFAHAIETSNKEVILVAIEQGPNDRRSIDYALEGSTNYLSFLENEMLPLIESNYRVNTNNRAIQGASWGGLLVRHALSREVNQPLFKHFISMDGSYFHENNKYREMEDIAFPQGSTLSASIYFSGALKSGNNSVVKSFSEALTL